MENWKHYFNKIILNRGKEYYREGSVKIDNRNEHEVHATVYGSEPYSVYIDLDDLNKMHCTCPYFETDNCKHLSALFYQLENRVIIDTPAIPDDHTADLDDLFNDIPYDILVDEYYQLLSNNALLRNDFLYRYTDQYDPQLYIHKIHEILDDTNYYLYSDEEENDLYYSISEYLDELQKLIPNQINTILQCLLILKEGLDKIEEYEYLDFRNEILQILNRILEESKPKQDLDPIFDTIVYFTQTFDPSFSHLLVHYFNEEKYYQQKVELLQSIIDHLDMSATSNSQINQYYYDYLYILYKHHEDIEHLIDEYYAISSIKQLEYDIAYEKQDYIKCIELANQHIIDDQDHLYHWYERLLDIYTINKDVTHQIGILKRIIIECKKGDIEYYHQLKQLPITNQDIEDIINQCEPYYLSRIYIEENRLKPLLENYLNHNCMYREEVENALIPLYSKELLQYYKDDIIHSLENANQRKSYRHICSKMTRMHQFHDPIPMILSTANYIRGNYSHKPALLDELRKVLYHLNIQE